MTKLPAYRDLVDTLADLGLSHSPAGYHGLLSGALCVADADRLDLARLAHGDVPAYADEATHAMLTALRDATLGGLAGPQGGFVPLLPDEDETLDVRAEALAQWCEGFTFALASHQHLDLDRCSPDVREIVQDFTELTRAGLSGEDDAETEEVAYTELVEYVRVGAQLVYVELRGPAVHGKPDRTLH